LTIEDIIQTNNANPIHPDTIKNPIQIKSGVISGSYGFNAYIFHTKSERRRKIQNKENRLRIFFLYKNMHPMKTIKQNNN